jgi:glycine betaine/proline transport system substrate-binding protein
LFFIAFTPPSHAADCKTVRLADIGWTDVSATTGVASVLLAEAGYTPKVLLLSLPVALAGLKNGDIDVYLGNWMPTQKADVAPYLADGSVETLVQNLRGAKYTLAAPSYTYDQGLREFNDIHRFKDALHGKIYAIEPGNDGNRLILDMIHKGDFGLAGFQVVESSEQGMLLAAKNAYARKEPIVFLGWAPHPMNRAIDMKYLSGGDAYFGANFGEASVFTLTRRGYAEQCPGLTAFLKNLSFTVEQENEIMGLIIDRGLSPEAAAKQWLRGHSKEKTQWLSPLLHEVRGREILPVQNREGASLQETIHAFSERTNDLISATSLKISSLPVGLSILFAAFFVFLLHRRIVMSLGVAAGLAIIFKLGLWSETIQTLTLVCLSTLMATALGIPIGIMLARCPRLDRVLNPLLDMMQTLPTFVYLIPTLLLFGLGIVPGLISTVIFAIAAPIRLTRLGIQSVPTEQLEVGDAFGATRWQKLIKIEIPSASPLLVEGISQCVMLSLSMVVIAALVGAEGLGAPVVRALNTVNLRMGAEAGAAIVILATILDRSLKRSKRVHP